MPLRNVLVPAGKRSVYLMAADAAIVAGSLAFATLLRFEFWPAREYWVKTLEILPVLVGAGSNVRL